MNEVGFIRSSTPRMDATPLGRMNEIQMINGCSSIFSMEEIMDEVGKG